jgi:hypothetical protein
MPTKTDRMIFPSLIWISVLMSGYAGFAGWPWQIPLTLGIVAGLATVQDLAREEPYLGRHVLSHVAVWMAMWGAIYFNAIYWLVRLATNLFG